MIQALEISSSALVAQRVRMNVIAGNIANAFTTVQEDGRIEPYRRRVTLFSPERDGGGVGVRVQEVVQDPSEFRLVADPGHKHAIQEGPLTGMVRYPNVNMTTEYVDAMEASRAYEANVALMSVTRGMIEQAIQLFA